MTKKIVSYLRVSTDKQGKTGLGIEAQRSAIKDHVEREACTAIAEYIEVESGKKSDRSELARAISHAKRSKSTLVVAKLDRLARNVALTSALMESNVEFVCCDNPHANRLTLHILSAVAEDEARRISDRTKAALKVAKKRGVLLGSNRPGHWDGREDKRQKGLKNARKASAVAHRKAFNEEYEDLFPIVKQLRDEGLTLQAIADELNTQGHTTRQDKPFSPMQVSRVLKKAA